MINLESNLFMVAEALALVLLTGCSKSEKPHCAISFACSPSNEDSFASPVTFSLQSVV